MSRAFTHERDDVPEPVIEVRQTGVPVRLTAAGNARFAAELERTTDSAERKRLADLLADAVVVDPPAEPGIVGFGSAVDVHGPDIGNRRFIVVGEREADIRAGRISETSPLGAALLGARTGDVVTWHRPIGDLNLTVDAIGVDPQASVVSSASRARSANPNSRDAE